MNTALLGTRRDHRDIAGAPGGTSRLLLQSQISAHFDFERKTPQKRGRRVREQHSFVMALWLVPSLSELLGLGAWRQCCLINSGRARVARPAFVTRHRDEIHENANDRRAEKDWQKNPALRMGFHWPRPLLVLWERKVVLR